MKTNKQAELVNSFMAEVEEERRPVYREIITCLQELGYSPKKEKANISFKHSLHNKQIAKMGVKKGKNPAPFFALRFSACKGYSQRFGDIVGAAIVKYPSKVAGCVNGGCSYCAGAPETHVYMHTFPDGESKYHCGAYALEIPDIAPEDIGEIKKLIEEEHGYLLEHEVNGNQT